MGVPAGERSRRAKRLLLSLRLLLSTPLLMLTLGGCGASVVARPGNVQEVESRTYVLGLFGSTRIDIRDLCQRGAVQIHVARSAADYVLSTLTLGMYFPQRVRITCQTERAR